MMQNISIRVKKTSGLSRLEQQVDGTYLAYISTPPVDGQANEKVIELLSDYFCVSKTSISIARGKKSKDKILKIC